ncbi:MAG: lysylphosphatidylglycerol synthase domain-containing protein [Ilumatobacteraceae bacterium]
MPTQSPLALARRLAPLVGLMIGAAGLAFVVRTLVVRSDEVADAFGEMNPVSLAGSVALGTAAMWSIGHNWLSMLATRGHAAPPRRAMRWYFAGQLGKYVPGGIWPIVGRAELAVRGGVSRPVAYGSTTSSMAATYVAATVVTGASSLIAWSYPVVGGALIAAVALAAGAAWSPQVRAVTTRLTSRAGVTLAALPSVRTMALSVAWHVPAWLLIAASTWVTGRAFGADFTAADIVFASTASWLAGFVVVGVPGGIGVREAVFTAIATPAVGSSVAVSVAVASRVGFIAVDLVGTALATAISGRAPAQP